MQHKGTVILETERLLLRRFQAQDAQAMFDNWASNPNVTKYLTWQPHESVQATQTLVCDWVESYTSPDFYQWLYATY